MLNKFVYISWLKYIISSIELIGSFLLSLRNLYLTSIRPHPHLYIYEPFPSQSNSNAWNAPKQRSSNNNGKVGGAYSELAFAKAKMQRSLLIGIKFEQLETHAAINNNYNYNYNDLRLAWGQQQQQQPKPTPQQQQQEHEHHQHQQWPAAVPTAAETRQLQPQTPTTSADSHEVER